MVSCFRNSLKKHKLSFYVTDYIKDVLIIELYGCIIYILDRAFKLNTSKMVV